MRERKSRKFAVGAIALVVLVFFAVPYAYTANPASCARCHEMEPYYRTWQDSVHSTAAKNCFYCHVKPGALNLAVYRVAFYREIYATVAGVNLAPLGASIPATESCRQKGCHSLNRLSGHSGDLKIDHRFHVTKARPRIGCPQCHRGASHPGLEKTGSKLPPRKQCKTCHRAKMTDCRMCHLKKVTGNFAH